MSTVAAMSQYIPGAQLSPEMHAAANGVGLGVGSGVGFGVGLGVGTITEQFAPLFINVPFTHSILPEP